MLKSFSWQSFLVFTGCLLLGWYLIVGIWFYAKDFMKFLQNIGSRPLINEKEEVAEEGHTDMKGNPAADLFALAHQLRDEIRHILEQAGKQQFPKEEMIMALQLRLRNYPQLNHTAFQVAINHYIAQESENQCSTLFSEDDLHVLWMG